MKLKEFFDKAIQIGIDNDPRGREEVEKTLERTKKSYDKLSDEKKAYFDTDSLTNPFADSRFLHGDPDTDIETILVGVDMEGAELLLADRLNEKGKKIDLVLAHHPEGPGVPGLPEVMYVQSDIWHTIGVPITTGDSLIDKRSKEVSRRAIGANCNRSVDFARILDIPFACVHTPADNCVSNYLQKKFDEAKPERVSDVIDILMKEKEYQLSAKIGTGPKMVNPGSEDNRAGKVLVDMTGGTSGPKEMIERIANTQIGTIVMMHIPEDMYKEAVKHNLNIVIAGHIASDAVGLNLLFDQMEGADKLNFLECSGYVRVPGSEREK